jgi:hypothetical protein
VVSLNGKKITISIISYISVPLKTNTEGCKGNYQCDSSVDLICNDNVCICPLGGNWFWSVSSNRCVECPDEWVIFSGHCYFINKEKLSWNDAEESCKSQGANLMKIDSDAEYDLTFSFYEQYANGGNLWVSYLM